MIPVPTPPSHMNLQWKKALKIIDFFALLEFKKALVIFAPVYIHLLTLVAHFDTVWPTHFICIPQ